MSIPASLAWPALGIDSVRNHFITGHAFKELDSQNKAMPSVVSDEAKWPILLAALSCLIPAISLDCICCSQSAVDSFVWFMKKIPLALPLLSWRSALIAYISLVAVVFWMIWVTPSHSLWHLWGLGGFVTMPLILMSMGKSVSDESSAIGPVLLAFVGIIGYSNVVFIPSFKQWYFTNLWGVNDYFVPSRMVYPFGIALNTEDIVAVHAISASVLACLIMFQWILMLRKNRTKALVLWHRRLGSFVAFAALPVMAISGVFSSIYVLRTPLNQATYGALPLIVVGLLIASIRSALSGDLVSHVDNAYSAFVVLCSAALYRWVCLVIHLSGHSYHTSSQAPVDGAAIITYLVLILCIFLPFLLMGRLKKNLFPMITLASILICSMVFLPWQFFGAPEYSNFLSHLPPS